MSDFYTPGGNPGTGTSVTSANIRSELSAVQAAFDKFPQWSANAKAVSRVNAAGNGIEAIPVDPTTFTPTVTMNFGLTAAACSKAQVLRVGKTCMVSGTVDLTPTGASVGVSFWMSTPVFSQLFGNNDACGSAVPNAFGAYPAQAQVMPIVGGGASKVLVQGLTGSSAAAFTMVYQYFFEVK